MLQHASINTFVKHYSVGIHVDVQAIVRGLPAQKQLMRFAASMSRSIDPRRPYKLDDTSCVNKVPRVRSLHGHVRGRKLLWNKKKGAFEAAEREFQQTFGAELRQRATAELPRPACRALKGVKKCEKECARANQRYQRAQREFRNEWQRQRNRLVRENLERYKDEQPVIDSERQLAGKLVDEEVMGALERTGYMTPQHMMLIDTVLTMPGSTIEKEYQRRIAAINAVIAFCDVEEGSPTRRPIATQKQKRCATDALQSISPAKKQAFLSSGERGNPICQAIASVCIKNSKERPTICFLCLGTPLLPEHERLKNYKTPGSLSRHFVDRHIKAYPKSMRVKCDVCNKELEHKAALMNHAEGVHGIVSRLPLSALGPI